MSLSFSLSGSTIESKRSTTVWPSWQCNMYFPKGVQATRQQRVVKIDTEKEKAVEKDRTAKTSGETRWSLKDRERKETHRVSSGSPGRETATNVASSMKRAVKRREYAPLSPMSTVDWCVLCGKERKAAGVDQPCEADFRFWWGLRIKSLPR